MNKGGAPRGNNNAVGSKGGGRTKVADEAILLELWLGKKGKKNIVMPKPKILYDEFKEKFGKNKGKIIRRKTGEVFKSGKDAFAYKVLTGDDSALRTLTSILFATKRAVLITNKEDQPIPVTIYLPHLKKVGVNQPVYVPEKEKIYPEPSTS